MRDFDILLDDILACYENNETGMLLHIIEGWTIGEIRFFKQHIDTDPSFWKPPEEPPEGLSREDAEEAWTEWAIDKAKLFYRQSLLHECIRIAHEVSMQAIGAKCYADSTNRDARFDLAQNIEQYYSLTFDKIKETLPFKEQIDKEILDKVNQLCKGQKDHGAKLAVIDGKTDALMDEKKKRRAKQIAGGKKGAAKAKEESGRDSQRAKIYEKVERRMKSGMKQAAAFAEIAPEYGLKESGVKSAYDRERRKREAETRGKYPRKGKKRGQYKTIGHSTE